LCTADQDSYVIYVNMMAKVNKCLYGCQLSLSLSSLAAKIALDSLTGSARVLRGPCHRRKDNKAHLLKPPAPTQAEVVSLAKQAFNMALDAMIAPPLALYSSMMSIYIDAKQIGQAEIVFSQMKDIGYDPTPEQYQQLIEVRLPLALSRR
jgi:hypothetical protein